MKVFLSIVLGAICLAQAKAICLGDFDEVEKRCAEPFKYTERAVENAYHHSMYPEGKKDQFVEYIGCVFRGWGFQNNDGSFNFDKMLASNKFEWQVGKICNDVLDTPNDVDPKKGALEYCSAHLPSLSLKRDEAAEIVRTCIVVKYFEIRDANKPQN